MTDISMTAAQTGKPTGPSLHLQRGQGPDDVLVRLVAAGRWTVHEVADLAQQLKGLAAELKNGYGRGAVIDLGHVERLDTAGAWLLEQAAELCKSNGLNPSYAGGREEYLILLREIRSRSHEKAPEDRKIGAIAGLLADIGRTTRGVINDLASITGFLGALTVTFGRIIMQPSRFRTTAFIHHIEHTGLRAVPIVSLICLFIGAVIMQQGAIHLRAYGASQFSVNLLGVLSLREIGVLLTAIMVAGRSGSAFTAAIGSMKMREEIDAMRTLGLDPMEVLVVPRVLALVVALPILAFIGSIMCLVGGGLAAGVYLGLDWATYWDRMQDIATTRHFMAGMLKTPFAAIIIGIVGCLEGMKVGGSAESLGTHVTSSVVKAIFIVIILDAIFAMFLSEIGI